MKCKECRSCVKGYFTSKPDSYVCIGVPEPFVINDINVECTEYGYKRNKRSSDVSVGEAIKYWEGLLKTLPEKLGPINREDYFSRMRVQHIIDVLITTINTLKKSKLKNSKEDPMKPMFVNGRWECPSCHSNNGSLNVYCDKCGQKIDWSK